METAKGIVKVLKKNKKGVQLEDGTWYSNNFKGEVECQVGDEVEIEYKTNGEFKNYETIKVLTKAEGPVEKVSKKTYDPVTMILSYVKDLSVANGKSMKENTVEILKSYSIIKTALSDEEALIQLIAEK